MNDKHKQNGFGPGTYVYRHPRPGSTPEEAECYRRSLKAWMEGNFPPGVYNNPKENAVTQLQVYPLYQWMKQGERLERLNRELAAGVAQEQQALQEELLEARMLLLHLAEAFRMGDVAQCNLQGVKVHEELGDFIQRLNAKPPTRG